ncbi:FUSC family protein [Apilactobacillus xinyiensis]|uniref:FUSC family protein n=1 Tax=Apilactobacillus xinyiensis TaxID=2841032 RepID=UPI001C7CA886|nr:FUSC family protein [Apilactobacillus xinyiensis]MCL0311550.1 FUSC family protein [Apilactobacillus xinyiensis]MCL0318306.1 FUSC family protein [Apilactobacillus xinyiensis]
MKYKINIGSILLKSSNFLALLISFIIAIFIQDINFGTFIALGALFFYYYLPQTNHMGIKTICLCGLVGLFSFLLISTTSFLPWLTPLLLSLICSVFYFYNKLWNLKNPGPFLLVMIACFAGVNNALNPYIIIKSLLFIVLGIIIALSLVLVNEFIFDFFGFEKSIDKTKPMKIRISRIPSNLLMRSFFYGFAIFLSFYISKSLNLFHFYWAVMACSAVLQAESMPTIFKRHRIYLISTMVGCLISYLVLMMPLSLITTMGLILIFNSLIYWKMATNYLVGNFFTTPMAILFAKLSSPVINDTSILSRLIAIIIGTTIAFITVYIVSYLKNRLVS